jgi:hypothetical protein
MTMADCIEERSTFTDPDQHMKRAVIENMSTAFTRAGFRS